MWRIVARGERGLDLRVVVLAVLLLLTHTSAAAFVASLAHAQSWPARPLRVVVFVPAGGGADLLARVVSEC